MVYFYKNEGYFSYVSKAYLSRKLTDSHEKPEESADLLTVLFKINKCLQVIRVVNQGLEASYFLTFLQSSQFYIVLS